MYRLVVCVLIDLSAIEFALRCVAIKQTEEIARFSIEKCWSKFLCCSTKESNGSIEWNIHNCHWMEATFCRHPYSLHSFRIHSYKNCALRMEFFSTVFYFCFWTITANSNVNNWTGAPIFIQQYAFYNLLFFPPFVHCLQIVCLPFLSNGFLFGFGFCFQFYFMSIYRAFGLEIMSKRLHITWIFSEQSSFDEYFILLLAWASLRFRWFHRSVQSVCCISACCTGIAVRRIAQADWNADHQRGACGEKTVESAVPQARNAIDVGRSWNFNV